MKRTLVNVGLVAVFVTVALLGSTPEEAARFNSLDLLWLATGTVLIVRTLRHISEPESHKESS